MQVGKVLVKYRVKTTAARRNVLEAIVALEGKHFCAEDIFFRLRHYKTKASRASIFRSIQLFQEVGILRLIEVNRYGCKFECVLHQHHDHLCCVKCGRVIEFTQDTIEKLQERVCREHGFSPTSHVLKITGTCKKCNKSSNKGGD